MNRIIDLILYRVIAPVLTFIMIRVFFWKAQCVRHNRLVEYNRETNLWIDQRGSVF